MLADVGWHRFIITGETRNIVDPRGRVGPGNRDAGLSPSRKKEIVRYISRLKSAEALERNVARAIGFLLKKERFVGRDGP